jgi:flagellum-specific peptidoglycan hydrolase FlgJ
LYALMVLAPSAAQAAATLNSRSYVEQADIQVTDAPVGDLAASTPTDVSAAAPDPVATDTQAATSDVAVTDTQVAASDVAAANTQIAALPTSDVVGTATDTPAADLSIATVAPTESHLPDWVQVVVASGSQYAADTSSDTVVAHLARYTYLRVINGGTSRLQVQAYSDAGTPGPTGWVSAEQVLPSAPGTNWLVAASATTLWSAADASGTPLRDVTRFAPLQQLAGPELDRIQVNVYRSDFSSVVGSGWVDVSATGPALAPQARVPGPTDRTLANRMPSSTDQQMAFLNTAAQAARQGQALTGVPASVTVAQAILESDWGRSTLAQNANNYFGMKVMGTLGNDGLVWMPTSEYDASGNLYQTTSAFRAYKSLADSTADHDRLLGTVSRYSTAMRSASDPRQFASLIAQAGYSTDPSYADKLVALMDRYNLYQLDA